MNMVEMMEMFISDRVRRGHDLQLIEDSLKVAVEMCVSDWASRNGWEMRNGRWERMATRLERAELQLAGKVGRS